MLDSPSVTVELLKSALASPKAKPNLRIIRARHDDAGRQDEGQVAAESAANALQSMSCAVLIADTRRRITYLNPEAERITGWKSREACGTSLETVLHLVTAPDRHAAFWGRLDKRADARRLDLASGMAVVRRDGTTVPVSESSAPLRDSDGYTCGIVILLQDVTHQRRAGRRLYHEATHDPLTDLFNRRAFENCLNGTLHGTPRKGTVNALICIDLDKFKLVNDRYGHEAGDCLLKKVASVIRSRVRRGDIVARLGGDEFAAILENCPPRRAEKIAASVREALNAIEFVVQGDLVPVSGSIGLVLLPKQQGKAAEVLRSVDEACYAAKRGGGDQVAQTMTSPDTIEVIEPTTA